MKSKRKTVFEDSLKKSKRRVLQKKKKIIGSNEKNDCGENSFDKLGLNSNIEKSIEEDIQKGTVDRSVLKERNGQNIDPNLGKCSEQNIDNILLSMHSLPKISPIKELIHEEIVNSSLVPNQEYKSNSKLINVKLGENVVKQESKIRKVEISKTLNYFEKRQMLRMADLTKIFGETADAFFTRSEMEIRKSVKYMNHATRFYLAVKFCRRNKLDFVSSTEIRTHYMNLSMCELLEVGRNVICNFINKTYKDDSIEKIMKKYNYLSPVEFKPLLQEKFFKKFATNYEELKIGGVFKKRKND